MTFIIFVKLLLVGLFHILCFNLFIKIYKNFNLKRFIPKSRVIRLISFVICISIIVYITGFRLRDLGTFIYSYSLAFLYALTAFLVYIIKDDIY